MFARTVSVQLKPNTFAEYSKVLTSEILPLLKKQKGFRDEITFSGDRDQITAISLWDSKESAVSYENSAYPLVSKMVDKFVEGTPNVRTSEVVQSTLHNLQATTAA
jgi:heme-degrading monooxygenase HmoA